MNVGFARPDISELMFCLFGRSVHPELLEIYSESLITQSAFQAKIRIIDAGHAIEFRTRNGVATEITTSRHQILPQKKRHVETRIRGSRDESYRFDTGMRYQTSYQLEQLDPDVYLNFHEELSLDCDRAEIAQQFPSGSRLAPGPLSLIQTDVCADSLLIHAFHTFPDSCAIVKTQSLFEL